MLINGRNSLRKGAQKNFQRRKILGDASVGKSSIIESQVYCKRTKGGGGGGTALAPKEMSGSILNFMLQILPNCGSWHRKEGREKRGGEGGKEEQEEIMAKEIYMRYIT